MAKKVIQELIFDKLKNAPSGYITTTLNVIRDLGFPTSMHSWDPIVSTIMSDIHRNGLLKPYNKKMVKLGYKKVYGRILPSTIYQIEENKQ
jgi:hypothetical protein